MKNFTKTLLASALTLGLMTSANATPLAGGGASLQGIIDSLYTCVGCTSNPAPPNVNLDQADESGKFTLFDASGNSATTMIIELAGNAGSNTFGVYDLYNTGAYVELFSGAAAAESFSTLHISASYKYTVGSTTVQFTNGEFGFYLGNSGGPTLYSQASLNGGKDQMVAYKGNGVDIIKVGDNLPGIWSAEDLVIAWEDILLGTDDGDYNDMVIHVDNIKIPEPGSLALLGLGLAGLGALSRRREKCA